MWLKISKVLRFFSGLAVLSRWRSFCICETSYNLAAGQVTKSQGISEWKQNDKLAEIQNVQKDVAWKIIHMDAVRPRVCEQYHLLSTTVKRAVEVREIRETTWACHDKAQAIVLTCLWPISIDRIMLFLEILLTHGSYLKYSFLSSLSASRFASGNMCFRSHGSRLLGDKQRTNNRP